MICVTVTPTSRTLAKADLLNAARLGDIVELCLDHFVKEPDVADLITAIEKPLIVSCRRPQDGGQWDGTEAERLLLLRQAIVAGPAYVELDLDIAPSIPRFGKTQRVISFTRLDRPETDIDSVFNEAASAKADVVKFTWPTPNLDAAWPLLAAIAQKRTLPVVGMGLGREELTLSLLGMKYGSPWVYAALEPGMQAHPGQATVFELAETFHCHDIDAKTAFIAVAGFGPAQLDTIRTLNNGFKQLQLNARCLPVQFGDSRQLAKMLDVLKIRAVIAAGESCPALAQLAQHVADPDQPASSVDLLLKKDDGWHGHHTLARPALKMLEMELGTSKPLGRQNVLVVGGGPLAAALAQSLGKSGAIVSLCGPDDKSALAAAQACGCRFVPFQNLYETLTDVLVLADDRVAAGNKHGQINPTLFRPHMTVLDMTARSGDSPLLEEAKFRGAKIVNPKQLADHRLQTWFKLIAGKELRVGEGV